MDHANWEKTESLFQRAADLPEADRRAFLEKECGHDPTLLADVLALLEADANSSSILDRGLAHIASQVIQSNNAAGSGVPREFGPYRVKQVLGEGGMGIVYLADRPDLGSLVAIKILRDAWLSPGRRARFSAEQRTLAQLNHPSIARLYDSGSLAEGTPWFVMEYVEGTAITEYCRQNASTLAERLRLFRDVCEAVQHAHSHLIVHRDLKPSNILVRSDGSVKLLDFGISKQLESLDDDAEQTKTSVRMMTPAYAAPEQIRGDRVGTHTDVYSLGVILYELLVGRLPFDLSNRSPSEAERIVLEREAEKPSTAAARMRHVATEMDYLRTISSGAWTDLDVLCLTAMHKDVGRRYRNVDALVRDIDNFVKQQPLEARADTARYRMGKFVSRNRRPLAAGLTVMTAAIALTIFYTARLAAARNTALAEASRSERIQKFTLNLLQGGDELVGPADSLRVVTLIDRGVKEARSLTREPSMQAELYETLGTISLKLGNMERADTLLRLSLDQRRSLRGSDHPDVAKSLIALGELHSAQARYDSAEMLVTRGLDMMKRHLPVAHPGIAKAGATLGQVLEEKGDYDRAIAVLDETLRLQGASGAVTPELAFTITELANSHFYAGNYAASDSLNRRVMEMDKELYGAKHPSVANDLVNLGAIQFEGGKFAEAERYYREALAIMQPWYGENHPATAANLTMLGRSLVSQKRLDEAVTVLERSVAINERVFGEIHPRVASA
ncbi:MAG TPA: serine/threonine-protein kinase, partial [Gemmatimonadaceae bacterium]|nr:serine/threonine-protein kinase [Gemmatimonadaceae bacterium]